MQKLLLLFLHLSIMLHIFAILHLLLLSVVRMFLKRLNPCTLHSKPSTPAMFARWGLEENKTNCGGSDNTVLAMLLLLCWYCLSCVIECAWIDQPFLTIPCFALYHRLSNSVQLFSWSLFAVWVRVNFFSVAAW